MTLFLDTAFANKNTHVTLRLQWKHQFEFAGFYAAKELGYYKDAGIDVEILEYENGTDIIEDVEKGRTDFGIWGSGVIEQALKGKPIILLANYFKRSPLAIVVQKEIQFPSDLRGKRLMIPKSDYESANYIQMFKTFKVEKDSIHMVDPTFGIRDFMDKKVDGMSVFLTNEPYWLQKEGVEYNLLDPNNYGVTLYDVNLFTSRTFSNKHPEIVKAFVDASNRGWKYALEHSEEIVDLILQKYNSQHKSKAHLMFEAEKTKKMILPDTYPVGSINEKQIERIHSLFEELGMISSSVDAETVIYSHNKSAAYPIALTLDEQTYIRNHPKVTYCFDPIYKPLEFQNEEGEHEGMTRDFMEIISKNSGLEFVPMKTTEWSQTLKRLENKECEMIFALTPSPERREYMLFTKPYLTLPEVLVNKLESPYITGLEDIVHQKIGILKGDSFIELIKKKYPDFNLVELEDTRVALKMIVDGELDGFIEFLPTLSLRMAEIADQNLKIAGRIDETTINIASHITEPLLQSILQKSLNAISEEEKKRITDKWIALRIEKAFDYALFWQIGLFSVMLFLGILYINYRLKSQVHQQVEELRAKDVLILQQSKHAAMGELIANIAHQWRQPLANLNGLILNFDYDNENNQLTREKIASYLTQIEDLSLHMSNTIEDFTNYFHPDKEKENFSMDVLVTDIKELLKFSFIKNNIQMILKGNTAASINTYYAELLQIMLILINNSKDAFRENGIKDPYITLEIKEQEKSIIIKHSDNAGGISGAIIDRIFEPYFSTKAKSQGAGLGLHIVKTLLSNSLNGTIMVENIQDGARFIIELEK